MRHRLPRPVLPAQGTGRRNPLTLLAKEYCGRCPVRDACLQWALDNNEVGIWGGLTQRERVVLRHGGQVRENYRPRTS